MKKIIIIFLLFPILTIGQIVPDQQNENFTKQIHEKVICFTDRNIYLSGELIWFTSAILVNNKIPDQPLSRVLYVELFDKSTKIIHKEKYLIDENLCHGSFQIPGEVLSGVYFLRVYTQFQRNYPAKTFTRIPLTIINPELTLTQTASDSSNTNNHKPNTATNISVNPGKSKFKRRELINLEIDFEDNAPVYSCISVVKHGTFIQDNIVNSSKDNQTPNSDSLFWIPDIRGVSLSGFVRDKNTGKAAENVDVYLSVFGKNLIFHIDKTQENGAFIFSLDQLNQNQNVFVSINPLRHSNMEILINNDYSNLFGHVWDYPFNINSSYKKLLTEMYINYQASNDFAIEFPATKSESTLTNLPAIYDITIRLDDFIELSSLQEVFYEIVPPVFVKSNKKGKYLSVANYQTQQVASADLILLDNVPIFDVDELLKIPAVNIESIEVINKPYYLGDYLLESIVSLKTKTKDFGGYKFPSESIFLEFQTLSPQQSFFTPDYSNDSIKNSPLPDFRTTLYWNPYVKTNQTDTTLSFFTSDAKGEYDIVIRGISNNGSLIFGKTSIVVD